MSIYDDIEAARKRSYGKSYTTLGGSSSNVSVPSSGGDINSQIEAARKRAYVQTPSQKAATQQQVQQTAAPKKTNWFDAAVSAIKGAADNAIKSLTGQNQQPAPAPTVNVNPNAVSPEVKKLPINLDLNPSNLPSAKIKNVIDVSSPKNTLSPTGSTISAAPPQTPLGKIQQAFGQVLDFLAPPGASNSPEDQVARAQNAYALLKDPKAKSIIEKQTGQKVEVNGHLNPELLVTLSQPGGSPFKNSPAENVYRDLNIGAMSTADGISLLMALSIPVTGAIGGTGVILNLGKFVAVSTAFDVAFNKITGKQSISDLLPNDTPAVAKMSVDALEFLGKAYLTHGLNKFGSNVLDTLTKSTVEKYNLPQTFQFSPREVQDVVIGKNTGYAKDILSKAGLTSEEWKAASKQGIQVSVPSEKVVEMTDKPYWAKIKSLFGIPPSEVQRITTNIPAQKTAGFGGYLPERAGQEFTPAQLQTQVEATDIEGTPLAAEMLKVIDSAKSEGKNIKIIQNPTEKDLAFSNPTPQGNKVGYQLVEPTNITLLNEQGAPATPETNAPAAGTTEQQFVQNQPATTPEPVVSAAAGEPATPAPAPEVKVNEPVTVKSTDELLTYIDRQGFRTPEQISTLKADIQANGIKYPVELIDKGDGTFEINDGTHRIQIANDLGIKEIPVKVVGEKPVENFLPKLTTREFSNNTKEDFKVGDRVNVMAYNGLEPQGYDNSLKNAEVVGIKKGDFVLVKSTRPGDIGKPIAIRPDTVFFAEARFPQVITDFWKNRTPTAFSESRLKLAGTTRAKVVDLINAAVKAGANKEAIQNLSKYTNTKAAIEELQNLAAKPEPKKEAKPAPKPEPKPEPKKEVVSKKIEDFREKAKEAKKITGKPLEKLTRAEIEQHFSGSYSEPSFFPLNAETEAVFKKIGSAARAISKDTLESKPALKYGGLNRHVFTDGFILLKGAVADKINEQLLEQDIKSKIKEYQYTSPTMSFEEAQAIAKKAVDNSIAEYKDNYPNTDKVIPTEWGKEPAHVQGFSIQNGVDYAFITDGNIKTAANANYLAFMAKELPDAKPYLTGALSPIVYIQDKQVVGLVMPIRIEGEAYPFGEQNVPQEGAAGAAKKGQFAELPVLTDNTFTLKSIAFPEMLRLAKEITGQVPSVKRESAMRTALGRSYPADLAIKLRADIFKDPQVAAKVLAHELGHITDFLPDHATARGNLVGRIATLNKHLKDAYGEDLSNKVIKAELVKLSNEWSPFNAEDKKSNYTKYRMKPAELYADAISVLFNDPLRVKLEAPNFYKGWFDYLDRKPTVKENFFAIQDLLNSSDEEIFKKRNEELTNSYAKAEEAWAAKIQDNQNRKTDILHALRTLFDDRNYQLNRRVTEQLKKGVAIEDQVNPMTDFEGLNYLDGALKSFVSENFQPAYELANTVPNGWDELGKILQMERVLGDRSEFANPGGYSPKEAQQFLDGLKASMSEADWTTLQQAKEAFREANNAVVNLAKEKGYYPKDLKTSDAYATFAVIDYLDTYISPAINQQIGTLKDIANPATATLMKAVSTFKAIKVNEAKKNAIDFTSKYYPQDVEPAETRFNGKYQEVIDSKDKDKGTVKVIRDGKVEGYYVEKGLAEVLNRTSSDVIRMAASLSRKLTLSPVYRPLFTSINLGFQTFNFVRDFKRYWKNIPDATLAQAITSLPRAIFRYAQAVPHAAMDVTGRQTQLLKDMEKLQILGLTYNDFFYNPDRLDEKMIERVLQKTGVLETTRHRKLTKPFYGTMSALETFGNFIERLPKVAGYIELKDKLPEKELANFIRNYIGSPNFRTQGSATPVSNNILMFSNAIKEGIKSDATIASGRYRGKYRRQSQAGFWWKTVIADFLPKLIMLGMVAGYFGEELKKRMANVSEYDKTNYTIIPFGYENGKTKYLRIPTDETGRFLGAMFWKSLNIASKKGADITDLFQIFSVGAGQFPNLVPSITGISALMDYMSGKNPYDSFRGRNIIPDTEFQAGVKYSAPIMFNWLLQNQGLGIIAPSYTPSGDLSTLEKIVSAPILSNIIGRWIKVSNYGQTEKNKEIGAAIDQQKAQKTLENRDTLDKAIAEYQKNPTIVNKYKLQAQYVKDTVGSPAGNPNYKRDRSNAVKKFNIAIQRQENDPDINSFLSAQSNAEKVAILKKIRENRGSKETDSIISDLRKQGLFSPALNRAYLQAIK